MMNWIIDYDVVRLNVILAGSEIYLINRFVGCDGSLNKRNNKFGFVFENFGTSFLLYDPLCWGMQRFMNV